MTRRPHHSERRQSELSRKYAGDFTHVPLHNEVADRVLEDDQLAQILDAAALANAAADTRVNYHGEDQAYVEKIEDAAGELSWTARQRALEVVAEVCQTIIDDGDDWIDEGHWETGEIRGAQAEAREWLQSNTNAAKRAGVLDAVSEVDA